MTKTPAGMTIKEQMITFSEKAEQPGQVSGASPSTQVALEPLPGGLLSSPSSRSSPQDPVLQGLQEVTKPKIGLIM